MKKLFALFTLSLILLGASFAQNNDLKFSGWKQAETEHFVFVYEEASREATEEFVKIADDAWNKVAKIYSIPQDKIRVYVTGRTNIVNALTYSLPLEIMMFTNPCNLSDFPYRTNWAQLFFTHELIHAANFSFEDHSKIPTMLFGDFANVVNFWGVDGWALEGLTTVLETELSEGGRGRSPYFELDYKSLTLDNYFLSYDEIGMENRPPAGQIYIMGYLLCRSIADRFGVQALADIERNRSFLGSWAESVKLVTGVSVKDLFSDVRISLAKKYADERKIPEGQIISPRTMNTSYYKPAIVFDDGTLITLRTAPNEETAVVRLDPSKKAGRNHITDTKPEKDLNTVCRETVLFTGAFFSNDSVTADENGVIYSILQNNRLDRFPGNEIEAALYRWTEEDGLKRITKGVSLFQPSVSRNGKLLVAVQQNGMHYRLVKVNPETGDIATLFENASFNAMQPQVNADGTKVTFLYTNDERARVAVIDVNNPQKVEIVANDDETIYDPNFPCWNKDGTITYTCNYRGRLEEYLAEKTEEGWISTPVVADPIGVLWAYKNDIGIFYSTVSSTGNVIKIKPADEWGVVPDFDGPSPAGEKICFGYLQNDYPDFKPYTVLSEVEITKDELEKLNDFKSDTEPVPVKGKVVKHRSEENTKKAEAAINTITTITTEKKFVPLAKPILYFPFVNFLTDEETATTYLAPGFAIGTLFPRTQLDLGLGEFDISYLPNLNNFMGRFNFLIQIGPAELIFDLSRDLYFSESNNSQKFVENNFCVLGYTRSVYHRIQHRNEMDFSLMGALSATLLRISNAACAVNGNFTCKPVLAGKAGFEYYWNLEGIKYNDFTLDFSLFALANISFGKDSANKVITQSVLGTEGEFSAQYRRNNVIYTVGVKGRYTPFPTTYKPTDSCVTYGGKQIDCSYAGRIVPRFQIGYPIPWLEIFNWNIYGEMLISCDQNQPVTRDESQLFGLEISYSQDRLGFATGCSFNIPKGKKVEDIFPEFYFALKYNWIRL